MRLLIVGSGPELPKLQNLAATLGVAQEVIFVPAVPKVADYMRSMDLFVSTSYSEAFSNSILEAMACGCCIVASRVGGTPELVADGERGLLFKSGDAGDLASKLTALIENPDRRNALARNAARFASENLNLDTAVNTVGEIYDKMLERKNVRLAA
jgi:glycosyltransferase involved in cell wall biosynthesis